MLYLFIGLIIIFFIVLFLSFSNKAREKKKLDEIRFQWAKPKTGDFDFDLIGKFSRIEDSKGYHGLSNQTLEDIYFYNLFALVDRTSIQDRSAMVIYLDQKFRCCGSPDPQPNPNCLFFLRPLYII